MLTLNNTLSVLCSIGTGVLIPVAIIVLIKLLFAPLKFGMKILLNLVGGFVLLFALNLIGRFVGLAVPVNLLTCAITGVFGIPGALGCLAWVLFA